MANRSERAAPAANGDGSEKGTAYTNLDTLRKGRGQLVDRFGHRHSESILTNWSEAALEAMRVRRLEEGA